MTALYHYEGHPFEVIGSFSFFDAPIYHQQIEYDSQYEMWRRWRYETLSEEFHAETHRIAEVMWKEKRPWWVALG